MSNKFYKISENRLRELLSTEAELIELEIMGVDNWSGYGECDWESIEGVEMDLSDFEEVV
jgi:hypothetical protein